jgi:hypothetical protein
LRNNVEWSVDVESKLFTHSFCLDFLGFIKVDNSPFLVRLSVISPNNDSLSFFISSTSDIENFLILNVNELLINILEDLEPSWVGAPDLHVVGLSGVFNVPWLVVQSSLDSQWLLVEVPSLGFSSILCLNDHISVADEIKVSVRW